jgi:hypothetical protein
MSMLLDLQKELQETAEAVARAERALMRFPDMPSVQATLQAMVQRQVRLREEFEILAQQSGFDVCHYKIETTQSRPPINYITSVLERFQDLFTTVYDAIVTQPKQIARASAEVIAATTFGFGFTFPGSIGVALTLDDNQRLLGDPAFDEAMAAVFQMMETRTPDGVLDLSRKYGVATIRMTQQWAKANASARFGADIQWQRKDSGRRRLRIQEPEINQLERTISQTTERTIELLTGELIVVDVEQKMFQMRVGTRIIRGTYGDAISIINPAALPRQYRAELEVSSRILSGEREEEKTYFLVNLEPT